MNRLVDLGATKANISTLSACGNPSGISSGITTPSRLCIASNYLRVTLELEWLQSSRLVGQAVERNSIPIDIAYPSVGHRGDHCRKTGLNLKYRLLRHKGAQL